LKGVLCDYKESKFKAAQAMLELVETKKQLAETRRQVEELNAAMRFVLNQPPNNGSYFHEVCLRDTSVTDCQVCSVGSAAYTCKLTS
jgi:hypothetical protein